MLYNRVPVLCTTDVMLYRVKRALVKWDLDVERLRSAADLRMLSEHSGSVCLLDADALRLPDVTSVVDGPGKKGIRFIVLSETQDLPPIGRFRDGFELCLMPFELDSLPRRILTARFDSWRSQVVQRIRQAESLPYVLREALVVIVRQRIPPTGAAPQRLRTVKAVAKELGISRGHLSRTASRNRVDLPGLADSYLAVLAHRSHEVDGQSWDAISWRFGYQSQAALNQLMTRTTSSGLRSPVSLESCIALWEDLLQSYGVR